MKRTSFSEESPFSNLIYCGECGSVYGRKHWHSTDRYSCYIWQCDAKYRKSSGCGTPHVKEEDLKRIVMEEMNRLIENRDSILKSLAAVLKITLDTSAEEARRDELALKLEGMKSLLETGELTESGRLETLAADFSTTRKNLDEIEASIADKKDRLAKAKAFIRTLKAKDTLIEEFDPILMRSLIDRIEVHGKNDIRIQFKCSC